MILTLYHDKKEPHKVYNCIKVTVDGYRTVVATVKQDSEIFKRQFLHEDHYQRLTIQVD